MQKHRVNKLAILDFSKQALKRATTWYAFKSQKPNGLSSYQIAIKVKKEFDGVGSHGATIWKYFNAHLEGMSPLKCGVKGDVPAWAFKSLCLTFESYVCIQQLNSHQGEITYKKLAVKINQVLKKDYRQKMLQRVLLATAKNLDASTMHIAEDRRVRWTTHSNISNWFENWEFDLVNLGFVTRDANGKVTIPKEQLRNIINFDETCLSLDGTEGRRGGCPKITLHDPRLPYNGKRSNKDSLTATLICGSNAAGEALPPHFQFQMKATTDEGHRLRNEVFKHACQTFGLFGKQAKEGYDPTFRLNAKVAGVWGPKMGRMGVKLMRRLCECII